MINHIIVLETSPGAAEVLSAAFRGWDSQQRPHIVSLTDLASNQPRYDCHALFELAAATIGGFLLERRTRLGNSRVAVVVDSAEWSHLNPLRAVGTYQRGKSSPVISLLILAFPEILWGFAHLGEAVEEVGQSKPSKFIRRAHLLDSWVADGRMPPFEPLMDASGLRNHVRKNAFKTVRPATEKQETQSLRKEWAVSMDDEVPYAYFNAYNEYRHGFRAAPVFSLSGAHWLLGEQSATDRAPMVSFEDLFISFPDQEGGEKGVRFSDFTVRDEVLPLLSKTKRRIILTSGQKGKNHRTIRKEIRRRKFKRMLKPMGGMFRIWRASGLQRALRAKDPKKRLWIGGYGPGYRPVAAAKPDDEGSHHSAPGALHIVASELLSRVGRAKDNTITVEDVLHCAVLATDAFELLASRTPTLSIDALAVKYELEAKAECCFNGVQNHFDVRSRLRRVKRAVKVLSKWSDPWQQDVVRWNSEVVVVGGLMDIFRGYGQFDEELLYAVRNRTLHRRLWFRQRLGKIVGTWLRWVNPIYWAAWYVGLLLRGIPTFLIMFFFWVGVLTWGFHEIESRIATQLVTADTNENSTTDAGQNVFVTETQAWIFAAADSFSCMVSVGTPLHTKVVEGNDQMVNLAYMLSCIGMGIGFLHLGIFISHLYSIVARKG